MVLIDFKINNAHNNTDPLLIFYLLRTSLCLFFVSWDVRSTFLLLRHKKVVYLIFLAVFYCKIDLL